MLTDKNIFFSIIGIVWGVALANEFYFLMGGAVYLTLWSIDLIVNYKE